MKLPGFISLGPSDGDGNLYVCSSKSTLVALSLAKGDKLWSFEDKSFLSCSPDPVSGNIFAFDSNGKTYSLSINNGEPERLLIAPHDFAKPPLVKGGYIYGSSSDGFVRAYPIP